MTVAEKEEVNSLKEVREWLGGMKAMTESEVCAPFSLRTRVNVHHSICVTGRLLITKKPINNMASRSVSCYFYLPPTIHKITKNIYVKFDLIKMVDMEGEPHAGYYNPT